MKNYELKKLKEEPQEPIVCYLEIVVMPNGEIIHAGKSLGWFRNHKKYVYVAIQKKEAK